MLSLEPSIGKPIQAYAYRQMGMPNLLNKLRKKKILK